VNVRYQKWLYVIIPLVVQFMMSGRDTNEHAPPSSAEEAAALLGAAISITDSLLHAGGMSSSRQSGQTNPPQGMHSIFAVQTPLPNQILFVRLVNLRAWLRWHAANTDADGLDDSVSVQQISNTAISTIHFNDAHQNLST
jgi:hypothetical protein